MKKTEWTSTTSFILASVGGAVGLANVWKFPSTVGANGGGAFILIYFLAVTFIAAPILIGELMIGRSSGKSPVMACLDAARASNLSSRWRYLGYMGISACFIVLTYYSVIAGWTIDYAIQSFRGHLVGLDAPAAQNAYNAVLADPRRMTLFHTIFMALTALVVSGGLKGGIEKFTNFAMPLFFSLLIGMMIYSAMTGAFSQALHFMFVPDFAKITPMVVLNAIGQAFFSIGIGFCFMMMYGAYMRKETNIPRTSYMIAYADMLVAVIAGLAIFPMVFLYGLNAGEGAGLIFVTLAVVFGTMDGGQIVGGLFFCLMMFAGLTSSIALLEPVVHHFVDRYGWARKKVTLVTGLIAWSIGLLMIFSYNIMSDFKPLFFISYLADKNLLDLMDFIVTNLILPIGAILICILVGWLISRDIIKVELSFQNNLVARLWNFSIRFVAPIFLLVILVYGLT
ncbi:sodium-dependent transporter [Paremcibacter congregatus]|uniref:sodium-dependent transporter n=1 Tax=Paremcibacter congregatus TaxID=2043170 RepID=UPI0030EC1813|tara:strand:- start:5789 stop:7147 length:1359 start_codon:yes stop_codon:yes gene_type:complete